VKSKTTSKLRPRYGIADAKSPREVTSKVAFHQ
jgi:hypothetical protein